MSSFWVFSLQRFIICNCTRPSAQPSPYENQCVTDAWDYFSYEGQLQRSESSILEKLRQMDGQLSIRRRMKKWQIVGSNFYYSHKHQQVIWKTIQIKYCYCLNYIHAHVDLFFVVLLILWKVATHINDKKIHKLSPLLMWMQLSECKMKR